MFLENNTHTLKMNRRSLLNSSESAPGFVYFNPSTPQQEPYTNKADTTEFLAFNDSPQTNQGNTFTPQHYSSPQKFQRFNSKFNQPYRNNKNRWSGNNYNKNGNNSPNVSYGSNHSRNSSFNQSSRNGGIEDYLHSSFLEDPWANLEKSLSQANRTPTVDMSTSIQ